MDHVGVKVGHGHLAVFLEPFLLPFGVRHQWRALHDLTQSSGDLISDRRVLELPERPIHRQVLIWRFVHDTFSRLLLDGPPLVLRSSAASVRAAVPAPGVFTRSRH